MVPLQTCVFKLTTKTIGRQIYKRESAQEKGSHNLPTLYLCDMKLPHPAVTEVSIGTCDAERVARMYNNNNNNNNIYLKSNIQQVQ